jgi:hypothetical protein
MAAVVHLVVIVLYGRLTETKIEMNFYLSLMQQIFPANIGYDVINARTR